MTRIERERQRYKVRGKGQQEVIFQHKRIRDLTHLGPVRKDFPG